MKSGLKFFSCCSVWLLTLLAFRTSGQSHEDEKKSPVSYGEKGFQFAPDSNFLLQVQGRLQFRFATPEDQDPVTFDDFSGERKPVFKINRARLKVGGHAFRPWIK